MMAPQENIMSTAPRSLIDVSSVELRERTLLAPYALHSKDSRGRRHPEPNHFFRGPFQRDRDRILHSGAFRRLSDKTQVFTGLGDYHRTRLTHTMEVSSIARTIGRALRLNEDLIEALALLHDIGHPPFGHAGEEALDEFLCDDGGFSHNQFALTIVEELEQRYPGHAGLNLTREVLAGQLRRIDKSAQEISPLLEVQVVDLADSITYDAHDVDDAVELGWLTMEELRSLPIIATCERAVLDRFGPIQGAPLRRAVVHELVNIQVVHLIHEAEQQLSDYRACSALEVCRAGLRLSTPRLLAEEKQGLEQFLCQRLYRHRDLMQARRRAQRQILELAEAYAAEPAHMPALFHRRCEVQGPRRAAAECIGAMTDHSFLDTYQRVTG
jgi:dGTPase